MGQLYNVKISDIINNAPNALNYNEDLVIIKMTAGPKSKVGDRIQIDAFSLILLMEGTLNITIDGKDYEVKNRAFLDVLDIHTVQNIRMSDDCKGYRIIISQSFIVDIMRVIKKLPIGNFLSRIDHPIMELTEQEVNLLENIVLSIIENIGRTEHAYRQDIIKNEVRKLFIEIANIIVLKSNNIELNKYKRKQDIIGEFVILVNKHCMEEHSVNFYAKELCVEVKYLSFILKAINGKSASNWIDEAIIVRAKMLLKDNNLTIQQIADMLHFSDQSAFGKFFKRNCRMTPLSYRKENM